jgi:membrane protease YdiL (CAAX protease family)
MSFKFLPLVPIVLLALTNYQLAKLTQHILLTGMPHVSYQFSLVIPWLLVCLIPCLFQIKKSGLSLQTARLKKNWKTVMVLMSLVVIGLGMFVGLGITQYFHSVAYPYIFFLATPLVEELLFRGFIYGQVKKITGYPVVVSAILFGMHHLQYFDYQLTKFALFQISYTFLLGIIFGLMRKKSGSIYPSLVSHIVINWITILV